MAVLQIVGDRAGAGKTSLAGALLLYLRAAGRKAAYFKLSTTPAQDDPDVSFLTGGLFEEVVSPADPLSQPARSPDPGNPPIARVAPGDIPDAVRELARREDLVLVESPDLTLADGAASTLLQDLALALESQVLLLLRYTTDLDVSSVAAAAHPLGNRLVGVIVNGVTAHRQQHARDTLAADLTSRGLTFLGALPEDRRMMGVTAQQLADHLGGRWAQDPEDTGAMVERFLIGGNIMDSGATYFGRYGKQAVVTRAARPDIQMASLMCDVSCLVLTGGGEPIEYVKAEAMQRGVPLILVESDTIQTAERLGGLPELATAHSRYKIERFLNLLQERLDLDALLPPAS